MHKAPSPVHLETDKSKWIGLALAVGVLVVYVRTLAPGALGGDAGEMQFVPAILSMPHPTGTPLYILLGKLWSMLPLGPTVAWRMNLLAAVSASLATGVVYLIVYEALEDRSAVESRPGEAQQRIRCPALLRISAALGAGLSLAFGLTFWEQALLGDKYAFNALMVSVVLYLTLRWGQTRSPATLNLLALTYGFSLTHHRTMALFAPTLLGYVWWRERGALWRDRRRLFRLILLTLCPLTLYLYLPWAEARGLPPGTWHPNTAREWFDYLFDTGRTGLVYVDPADLGQMLAFYARTLVRDFTWVGIALGLIGLAVQLCRRMPTALLLASNWLAQAFLAANHHVPRQWVYFIPSFVIWAVWTGEALGAIGQGIALLSVSWRRWLAGFAWAGAALATLAWSLMPAVPRYGPLREVHLGAGVLDVWRQTLKEGRMADRVGAAIANVAPGAVILCDWEQATPLWYYQQVEGLRPDVQIVYPVERLEEMAQSGRPLYVARALSGLADRWYPSCSDSLITLHSAPQFQLSAEGTLLGTRLGREGEGAMFELAAFAYGAMEGARTTVVPVTLYWRALERPDGDYSVSMRLLDPTGQVVFQVDSQHPVLGTYPTSRWEMGQVVADYYELQVPGAGAPAGSYRWGVVLYRALPTGGWESLRTAGEGLEMAIGGSFDVY